MPRRRAGAKYQIRRAIARQCLNFGRVRGNNKSASKLPTASYFINHPTVGNSEIDIVNHRPKLRIISNISFTKTVIIVDQSSSYPLGRIAGTSRYEFVQEYHPICETISEASTISRPSTPSDIEIVTLD